MDPIIALRITSAGISIGFGAFFLIIWFTNGRLEGLHNYLLWMGLWALVVASNTLLAATSEQALYYWQVLSLPLMQWLMLRATFSWDNHKHMSMLWYTPIFIMAGCLALHRILGWNWLLIYPWGLTYGILVKLLAVLRKTMARPWIFWITFIGVGLWTIGDAVRILPTLWQVMLSIWGEFPFLIMQIHGHNDLRHQQVQQENITKRALLQMVTGRFEAATDTLATIGINLDE